MTTSLDIFHNKLCSRLRTLDSAFDRHLHARSSQRRIDRFSIQEGLVSALWQSWCAFCRQILIGSASGSVDRAGNPITSPYAGHSEMEIAFIAKTLSEGRKITKIKPLKGSHLEPTWGDLKKANLIITGLSSTNQPRLLTAFSAGLFINDLQLCRNTNAHVNKELMTKINAAKVRYDDTKLTHPSDLIFWVDPATHDFLWKTWVDEIQAMSQHATT